MRVDFEARLRALGSRIELFERFLGAFASGLPIPQLYRSEKTRGFRYVDPDIRHFCLLKGVRAVSGLNAALELARTGYIQELFVLIRTIIECTTHIEFVLSSRNSDGNLEPDAAKYVEAYFSDFVRNGAADDKRPQVRQRTVHRTVGARLDSATGEEAVPMVAADILMSNVYLNLSNFVHARYPEAMDLYGGVPRHFHFRGMSGTPKDAEIIENLETYVTTVSLTLKTIASELKMLDLVVADSALADWFRSSE